MREIYENVLASFSSIIPNLVAEEQNIYKQKSEILNFLEQDNIYTMVLLFYGNQRRIQGRGKGGTATRSGYRSEEDFFANLTNSAHED